jgi:hypothetical protein
MDQGDGGSLGGSDGPALAQKVDLLIGVDPSFEVERQVEVQQGGRRTGAGGGALFFQGFFPGDIGAQAGGPADGGVLALDLPVEHDLGGGRAADYFIGQDGDEAFLESAKAAFDLAFGLGAGSDQMRYAQRGEGTLELRTGIAVIGHGIVAKETQTIGVDDQRQGVGKKETAKMLEMVPGGVGGDKDRAQEPAGMIVNGQQEGLFLRGGPPLVEGGIVLPEFIDPGAFPAPSGLGPRSGLTDEVWKMGGHRLAMTLETETGCQFVGHQLEVGRRLEREELLEEGEGFGRPVGPMVAAGEPGGQAGAFCEEAGAEAVKVGATDLEMEGGLGAVDQPLVELLEDLLEKRVGEAFGELLFLIAASPTNGCPLVEGIRRPSLPGC